jgi:serpin B
MRISLFLLFLCAAMFLISANPAPATAAAENSAAGEAASAVNAFAVDMYLRLAQDAQEKDGLFFSPYSISSALAMVYAGADGETALEMAKVLHLDGLPRPHLAMKDLKDRFDAVGANEAQKEDYVLEENTVGKKDAVFAAANRVWTDAKEELLPGYTDLVRLNYGGGVESLDFKRDVEGARAAINTWVDRETLGNIQYLLRAGDVDEKTRLVLTNAVYFHSGWVKPFNSKLTSLEPFHAALDETKDVPTMRMTASFLYGEDADLQFVKIPYKLPGFSLLVLLPRANATFTQMAELEKKLSPRQLSDWAAGMDFRSVSLHLPKFRSEGRYLLEKILKQLGMSRAFTRDADFSKMVKEPVNEDGVLHVDSVIHQSFIELDEKGTEAAAATAVTMTRTTAFRSDTPVEFRADRPFIYCLTDEQTGTILFMGRLTAP